MEITNDIVEINKRVCFDLWQTSAFNQQPSTFSPRIIFPEKRDNTIRISEQESRILFINQLNQTQFFYSIETPTEDVYQQSGSTSMSASSDLSIYGNDGQNFEKIINTEFKAHNVNKEQIKKDIEKLLKEKIAGNWFHTLKNIDSGTIPSLFEKFTNSLTSCYSQLSIPSNITKSDISLIFCFCVLEKRWACLKHFSYQSTTESQKHFEEYVNKFFKLDYSVSEKEISIKDSNDWIIYNIST